MAIMKKRKKNSKCWEKWRNWNSCSLLWDCKWAATVENSGQFCIKKCGWSQNTVDMLRTTEMYSV